MRDPYLYDDVDVLKNKAQIRDSELLRRAEADITHCTMSAIYGVQYHKFDEETLCDIHRQIFGPIYDWAGEYRTIQMIKREDILGGDTVRYSFPQDIKKEISATMKEIRKLKRNGDNDRDIVFRLVRIVAAIWHIHPFREGNTRTVIVFAVLLGKRLGFDVDCEMFEKYSRYVRNALVWGAQGMYSRYEYLENIFFEAMLGDTDTADTTTLDTASKYEKIGDYKVSEYQERPHEYLH